MAVDSLNMTYVFVTEFSFS